MSRIKLLSQYTANQIAAGEVVERPASIVKELLENSIDAGSTSITIEISGGGIEYLRVTDNGCGMEYDDAKTAFLRHATSKISNAEDLTHIETLGFRGEALASIAAVAHVVMRTRTSNSDSGTIIRVSGGDISEYGETGCIEGTSIEVSNLFYNVPARLKFLKSARAEAAYISDYVSRMILAKPQISIKLIQNGKTLYHSSGDGILKNAVYCIYGSTVFPFLRDISYDDGYVALTGYIGTDDIARSNRTHQSFFINERYIKSQKLSFAVQRAFDTRIMAGRFPFVVINVSIAPNEIDVNVHPNKLDVRFKDEERVIRAATIAARMALGDPVAPVIRHDEICRADNDKSNDSETQSTSDTRPCTSFSRLTDVIAPNHTIESKPAVQPSGDENSQTSIDSDVSSSDITDRLNSQSPLNRCSVKESEAVACDFSVVRPIAFSDETTVEIDRSTPQKIVSITSAASAKNCTIAHIEPQQTEFLDTSYKIVGQLFECYWLVQQGETVFVIDQHAAHERILYEKYMSGELSAESQLLLIPTLIKLSAQDYECLIENIDEFRALGFDIEEFGTFTVSVRAVPYILGQPETERFLFDAISMISGNKKATSKDIKRASIIQAACKHAVKAGDMLAKSEVESLIAYYSASGVPMTCPHGRPVMVVMKKSEFEKMFKRIV